LGVVGGVIPWRCAGRFRYSLDYCATCLCGLALADPPCSTQPDSNAHTCSGPSSLPTVLQDNKQCDQPWVMSGMHCRATCGRCRLDASPPPSPSPTPSPSSASSASSSCTDVVPSGVSCASHKAWGNCPAEWMKQGGFCARTCGRC